MDKHRRLQDATKSRPTRPTATYEIGYGRPPQAHQFKFGTSGNPQGRPKGAKNADTIVNEILDRLIKIRNGRRSYQTSVREAILEKIAEDARQGNPKAAAFLLDRYDNKNRNQESSNDTVEQSDQQIIDGFFQRDPQYRRKEEP